MKALMLKKHWYTPREVADRVGVSRQTIVKWINQGRLEAETLPSGHHRIPAAAFVNEDAHELLPVKEMA